MNPQKIKQDSLTSYTQFSKIREISRDLRWCVRHLRIED